jgi:hypothetical protein
MSVESDALAFQPSPPVRHTGPADAAAAAKGYGRAAGETLWCRFNFETAEAFAERVFADAAARGFEAVEFLPPRGADS